MQGWAEPADKGAASDQSELIPRQKNMLGRNTKNSLKAFSHLQKLTIPHQHVTQLLHNLFMSG